MPPKQPGNAEKFSQVTDSRSCTDFFCYIIYIAFCGFLIYASVYGFINGDLRKIAQPYDVDSNPCGREQLEEFPYLFFTEYVTNPKDVQGTVCVKECSQDPNHVFECYPNSAVTNCGAISYYPTSAWMDRFCISE